MESENPRVGRPLRWAPGLEASEGNRVTTLPFEPSILREPLDKIDEAVFSEGRARRPRRVADGGSRVAPPEAADAASLDLFKTSNPAGNGVPALPFKQRIVRLSLHAALFSLIAFAPSGAAAEPGSCAGITEPFIDVALSLPVAGIMATARLKEGDFVQANEVILELDERLEALEVERRRIVMDNSKADWESTKVVFEKTSAISRDVLLKKEADYKVATTEYNIASEELKRRKLVAPAAGVITELKLHPGEACTAYQPVARLVDTRKCYFECNLDSGFSVNLEVGKKVKLLIDSGGAPIAIEASIVFVSPVVDSASGLQRVKAVFENQDGRIRPGLAGKLVLN